MSAVKLIDSPIDVESVIRAVETQMNGAIVSFIGSVRNHSRGVQVSSIDYEAYRPLADNEMQRIAQKAEERWTTLVAIVHRIGEVAPGENSIAIAVSSEHRKAAFEACEWILAQIKESVPIWKREICEHGARWIEGAESISIDARN